MLAETVDRGRRANLGPAIVRRKEGHGEVLYIGSSLEAVYEEKNQSLDNKQWILNEAVSRLLFKHHPYGQQTTIGEVEHLTPLRPLVRRPTAGGIVPHDRDWTYSVAVPTAGSWYGLKAIESYRRIHEWIKGALARLEIPTMLAPCCLKSGPGQCFVGYEQFDLLWQGRKIAGAAQRRTRHGLLIQGSLQPPPAAKGLGRKHWQEAMVICGTEFFGIAWVPLSPEPEFQTRARLLAQTKYSQVAYNRKR